MRGLPALLAAILALSAAPPVAATAGAPALEAAVRILRRAAHPQRDNGHLPLLLSLRQLGDPTLAPLFKTVAQRDDWQMQVHGLLGLAEIDPARRLDMELARGLHPQGQDHLLAQALDHRLMDLEDIRAMLEWPELRPMPRLLLLADLVAMGHEVDRGSLESLASDPDLQIAGLAACLLGSMAGPEAVERFAQRTSTLPQRQRDQLLAWLFGAIGQYRLTAGLPLVERAIGQRPLDRDVCESGLLVMLQLDQPRGLEAWHRLLQENSSHAQRVRLGLTLLAAGPSVPPQTFHALAGGEELIQVIIELGVVQCRGGDLGPPLMRLLDLDHPRSAAWAMSRARSLPPEQALPVYQHVIAAVHEGPGGADRAARAVQAVTRICSLRAELLEPELRRAGDESLAAEVLLLGMFECECDQAGRLASLRSHSSPRRSDSMALILVARHAPALEQGPLQRLGTVAAGGGRVSELLQAQAAWLYLRHSDLLTTALPMILDGP